VELPLDQSGDELVQLGHLAVAEPGEVVAAALGTGLLVLADLVLDLAGDELPLLLCVFPPLLERRDPLGLGAGRVADFLGHRRHLLGALAEDVALQLVDGGLLRDDALVQRRHRGDGLAQPSAGLGEFPLQSLRPLPPLAPVFAATHP